MRVLLVEDEKGLSSAICQVLKKENFTVDPVYTGTDGLDYALDGEYDAMILDVMLPGMDGFQILKRIREKGIKTPVCMLTARSGLEDRVLRNLEVQIRTHIQTIIRITTFITLVVIPNLCHITLVLEVKGHEIFHGLCTTREIDVRIIGQGGTLEHLLLPINVWIPFSLTVVAEVVTIGVIVWFDGIVLIAEIIDERLRTIISPRGITA